MGNCAQCKYGEKWDNDEYHCLKEIGTENSSLHSGNWFCADFKETNSCDADEEKTHMTKTMNINGPINPYTPLHNSSNNQKDKRKQIEYDITMYENGN